MSVLPIRMTRYVCLIGLTFFSLKCSSQIFDISWSDSRDSLYGSLDSLICVHSYFGGANGQNITSINLSEYDEECYFQFRFTDDAGTFLACLDNISSSDEHCFHVDGNNYVTVNEDGNFNGIGTYSGNDLLTIYVKNGTFEYQINGSPVYSSSSADIGTYRIYCEFSTPDTLLDVKSSFLKATPIIWDAKRNVDYDRNSIMMTATSTTTWESGSFSHSFLEDSDTGYIILTIDSIPSDHAAIGFSFSDSDDDYATTDYALYFDNNGNMDVYESGTWQTNLSGIQNGEYIRLIRDPGGGQISVEHNTINVHNWPDPGGDLYVDLSLEKDPVQLSHLKATFSSMYINSGFVRRDPVRSQVMLGQVDSLFRFEYGNYYNADTLQYKLLDMDLNVLAEVEPGKTPIGGSPVVRLEPGINDIAIDFENSITGIVPREHYLLEITNPKGNTTKFRFFLKQ